LHDTGKVVIAKFPRSRLIAAGHGYGLFDQFGGFQPIPSTLRAAHRCGLQQKADMIHQNSCEEFNLPSPEQVR